MRKLAATMFAAVGLAICSLGLLPALPMAGGIDRAVAAEASGRGLTIDYRPRRKRVVVVRRSAADYLYSFYPQAMVSSGVVVGGGYPYYYIPNGYPYYYAGAYWPHYYGRYRYPRDDYSPNAFFGYNESDFR
jgi:hypothetical protein